MKRHSLATMILLIKLKIQATVNVLPRIKKAEACKKSLISTGGKYTPNSVPFVRVNSLKTSHVPRRNRDSAQRNQDLVCFPKLYKHLTEFDSSARTQSCGL